MQYSGMMAMFTSIFAILALLLPSVRATPVADTGFYLGQEQVFSVSPRHLEPRAFTTPLVKTLKLLQFNMAGAAKNGGTYVIIGRIIREIQERNPDVVSLNEICSRQWSHLLEQLEVIGYEMNGYFGQSRTVVWDCYELPDPRNDAGNGILVRAPVLSTKGYVFTTDNKLEERDQPTILEERSVACVVADFGIPNQSVKVCSTHLASKDSASSTPYAIPGIQARELARVFGPEAGAGSFILLGDMNLLPNDPALSTLYAPEAGNGVFWEADQYFYCDDEYCDGPVQGGDATAHDGKIDYTFMSRKHFSFDYQNVEVIDAGMCDTHECSDHKMYRSTVRLHQTVTPYGTLKNTYSGKCAMVAGTTNNAAVLSNPCNASSSDHRWRWEHAWWGEYLVRKENGGKCLRMPSTSNVGAQQSTCNENDSLQRWFPRAPAAEMMRCSGTAKCLAVAANTNGAAVSQTTCSTTVTQQRWTYP